MSASATSAAPIVPPIQPANHFSLTGHGIHVDYSTTSLNGQPQLNYHDQDQTRSFMGNEIRVADVPDLGSVVSVTLHLTVDVGSTSFSVLVPPVTVSGIGGSAPVSTDGITTIHKMPFAPPLNLGQRDLYQVTRLSGFANHIIS